MFRIFDLRRRKFKIRINVRTVRIIEKIQKFAKRLMKIRIMKFDLIFSLFDSTRTSPHFYTFKSIELIILIG